MTRLSKFVVSVSLCGLAVAALSLKDNRAFLDDEDEEEELLEKAQAADAGPAAKSPGYCGVERWAVKTLSDPDAASVQTGTGQTFSVDAVISDPPRAPWPPYDPANPVLPPDVRISGPDSKGYSGPNSLETQMIRMRVLIQGYKLENDKDLHIVVADPTSGNTMIVEMVDSSCDGASKSQAAGQYDFARTQFQAFLNAYQAPPPGKKYYILPRPAAAVVRGVRFFDPKHKQLGVAPNGVELHPVLCFKPEPFSGSECDPAG